MMEGTDVIPRLYERALVVGRCGMGRALRTGLLLQFKGLVFLVLLPGRLLLGLLVVDWIRAGCGVGVSLCAGEYRTGRLTYFLGLKA